MNNFLIGSTLDQIGNFVPNIYEALIENLKVENYQIQKLTLQSIKLLGEICKEQMQGTFKDLMTTLLTNAESSIDASTNEGVEIHILYVETACSLIKEVKSPEKGKFEPKIMSLLMANQNSISEESDPRWSILFDCWISILDSISPIPPVPRNGVLKIINSGM
jgi:hypothetical protein